MSRQANCDDNAALESFWSTLKEAPGHRRAFVRRAEAASARFDLQRNLLPPRAR